MLIVTRAYRTSPGGRVFAVVLTLLCFVVGLAALALSIDALTEGRTSLRLRRGGRIHLDGWLAYAYGLNGLIFGAATLCFAGVFAAAGLGPQRWGRPAFAMLRLGAVLFMFAAVGAMAIGIALLVRSFA